MPPGTDRPRATSVRRPHPDDARNVEAALADADAHNLLSSVASEGFLRWLEGSGDESWRGECA
jgi:hypothetical protein